MTIEDRAKDYASNNTQDFGTYTDYAPLEEGYIHGATEQKQIDADLICDLMIAMLNDGMIETRDIGAVNMQIRKAMEE